MYFLTNYYHNTSKSQRYYNYKIPKSSNCIIVFNNWYHAKRKHIFIVIRPILCYIINLCYLTTLKCNIFIKILNNTVYYNWDNAYHKYQKNCLLLSILFKFLIRNNLKNTYRQVNRE